MYRNPDNEAVFPSLLDGMRHCRDHPMVVAVVYSFNMEETMEMMDWLSGHATGGIAFLSEYPDFSLRFTNNSVLKILEEP